LRTYPNILEIFLWEFILRHSLRFFRS
jgi:hypothetical protein